MKAREKEYRDRRFRKSEFEGRDYVCRFCGRKSAAMTEFGVACFDCHAKKWAETEYREADIDFEDLCDRIDRGEQIERTFIVNPKCFPFQWLG